MNTIKKGVMESLTKINCIRTLHINNHYCTLSLEKQNTIKSKQKVKTYRYLNNIGLRGKRRARRQIAELNQSYN